MTVTVRGIFASIAAVLIAAICVRLGFWQLDRLDQRRERNAAITAATTLPTLDLSGDSLEAVARDPDRYRYRRARVSGTFLQEGDFLLRGRAMEGRPGVHLVTPLRIQTGDTAILVLRGWIPAPDAATADPHPYAVTGPQSIEGVIETISTAGGPIPMQETVDGRTVATFQRIDPRAVAGSVPYSLLPVYLQILPGSAQEAPAAPSAPRLRRVPLPPLDEGPHLGYALQWFGFAVVAIGGMVIVLIKEHREGR